MYVECARQWDTTGGAVPQTDLSRYPLCPKQPVLLRTTDRPHTLVKLNRDAYKILLVHSNEGEAYKIILVFIQGYTCTVLFMITQLASSTWDIHFMMGTGSSIPINNRASIKQKAVSTSTSYLQHSRTRESLNSSSHKKIWLICLPMSLCSLQRYS